MNSLQKIKRKYFGSKIEKCERCGKESDTYYLKDSRFICKKCYFKK